MIVQRCEVGGGVFSGVTGTSHKTHTRTRHQNR